MLEVTCVPAIMEETLIREYTVNLPTPRGLSSNGLSIIMPCGQTVEAHAWVQWLASVDRLATEPLKRGPPSHRKKETLGGKGLTGG